jgi:hypothetical protein
MVITDTVITDTVNTDIMVLNEAAVSPGAE